MNQIKNDIFITVAVVAYNSSNTIIETLDSVKQQTYTNIELIISDDCSTDDTLGVVNEWLIKNKERFVRVQLLTSTENKGIAPNRNKCIWEAQGEWIKFVDGDDLLTENAIESYLKVINDRVDFVMGSFISFNERGEEKLRNISTDFFHLPIPEQLKEQTQKAQILWPGIFLKRSSTISIGGLDERFPMLDDFPFFIKALENNCRFTYTTDVVFKYRVHAGSAQRSTGFHKSHVFYVNQVIVPKYKKEGKYIDYWHDKLWSAKEIAKLDNNYTKSYSLKALMLFTDVKEWYYMVRDKVYRPIVFKWRALRK